MRFALALAALAVLTAAPAAADSTGFLDAVGPLGYTGDAALRDGYAVCVLRTEADADLTGRVIRGALERLNRDAEAAESPEFAALAVEHLCPELA